MSSADDGDTRRLPKTRRNGQPTLNMEVAGPDGWLIFQLKKKKKNNNKKIKYF